MLTRPATTASLRIPCRVSRQAWATSTRRVKGAGDGIPAVVRDDPLARGPVVVGGAPGFTAVDGLDGDRGFGALSDRGQFPQHFETLRELGAGGLQQQRGQRRRGFTGSSNRATQSA